MVIRCYTWGAYNLCLSETSSYCALSAAEGPHADVCRMVEP